jgi:hypothetical protein
LPSSRPASFRATTRQITIREGVIIADPAQVVDLVRCLRPHIIAISSLRIAG